MIDKKDISIICSDGFALSAILYSPENLKGAVMICPATGIKKRFYNSFATHLAENGYGVICFDNRGIGDSKKGSINKVDASLINWGKLDMTAVLEKLKASFPNSNYHLVGHSAGGQLVGLMDNGTELKSIFNFAASSGQIKNMPYPFKFSALFFLICFIHVSNFLFGRCNSQWVGMGEPLPKKVAAQWSRWCNGAGYCATDFGKAIKKHHFDELLMPSLWLLATDDGIANLINVKDMIRVFPNSKAEIISLVPKEHGFKDIGHMKFFSSKRKELWNFALDWLEANR